MLVNGIERNAIEHKGTYSGYVMPLIEMSEEERAYHQQKADECREKNHTWHMAVLIDIGYNINEYHFYEYEEWEDDYKYTVIETSGGTKVYTYDKKIHRFNDKPALLGSSGAQVWYQHGLCHRELGPALIDGEDKQWLQNDVLHNEHGPASIVNGVSNYYLRGTKVFKKDLKKLNKGSIIL